MTIWQRIRSKILIPAAMASVGIAAYLTDLAPTEKAAAIADLEQAAIEVPELAPWVREVCPDCSVDPKLSYWRIGPKSFCRWQDGAWVHCGPGAGCDVACPLADPTLTGREFPANGSHRGFGRQVRRLIDNNDRKGMRKAIRRIVRRKRRENPGTPQAPLEIPQLPEVAQ